MITTQQGVESHINSFFSCRYLYVRIGGIAIYSSILGSVIQFTMPTYTDHIVCHGHQSQRWQRENITTVSHYISTDIIGSRDSSTAKESLPIKLFSMYYHMLFASPLSPPLDWCRQNNIALKYFDGDNVVKQEPITASKQCINPHDKCCPDPYLLTRCNRLHIHKIFPTKKSQCVTVLVQSEG